MNFSRFFVSRPRFAAVLSVIITFVRPTGADKKATTTWFDMFRIENGRIAEHRDCAPKE